MLLSLRAVAALLSYPDEDLAGATGDMLDVIAADSRLAGALPGIEALVDHIAGSDLLDLQEEYVGLFDRTRSLCLNLFEHVHGEGRERGSAMVELNGIYAAAGLEPRPGELPDYLPMLIEFAAVEPERGAELLANAGPVLDLLHGRLLARGAPHAALLHASLLAAGLRPSAALPAPEPEETPEALDAAWAEAPGVIRPGAPTAPDCGVDVLAAKLRAARRNPNPMPPRRPVIRHVAAASQG